MRTKILVAIILLICMTFSLTSCFIVINHKEDEPKQTDAPTPSSETEEKETKPPAQTFAPQTDALSRGESEAEELMTSYWDKEYEGKVVITMVEDYVSLFANEGSGTFSRAMGLRNELIDNTFSCEIEVQMKDYDTFFTEAASAKNAGLFYTDIVILPYGKLGELAQEKLLCNLADYCDYSTVADTFDKYNIGQLSAGKQVLGVLGDATFHPSSYLCVYYNKTLASSLGLDNLNDAVDNGEWTLGKMMGYRSTVATLGEGNYCIGSDYDDKTLFNALFTSSGMKYMSSGLGVVPEVVGYDTRTDNLITELKTLMNGGVMYCKNDEITDKKALFEEGKMLFYIGSVADSLTLNNNFGVLPLPKLDKEQEKYRTYVNEDAPVMCVLTTASDIEKSVGIINAHNDASAMLFDGYMRDFLDFYARDGKSAEMIIDIVNNVEFDFANAVSSEYDGVRYSTSVALYESVTLNKSIEWYYNMFRGSAANEMRKAFPQ